jgi:hypothetical protein
MTRSTMARVTLFIVALMVAGCDGADDRHVFSLQSTGLVEGQVFLDLNRDGQRSSGEAALAGVEVRAVPAGGRTVAGTALSGEEGRFSLGELRVGTYDLEVSGAPLGDSLVLTGVNPSPFEVRQGAATSATVGLSFRLVSAAQLQTEPEGRRLYVEGVALNARGQLADNAVHVWDGERAVRAMNVGSFSMTAGDSVRILGHTARVSGRTVLTEGQGFRVAERPAPTPIELTTAEAASAAGGTLDAALVRVRDALVSNTQSVAGGVLVTLSDGSGSLQVRIPDAHLSAADLPRPDPGAVMTAVGVLVPREAGSGWELRTRSGSDLAVEAVGGLRGQVFFDLSGNDSYDGSDLPLQGIGLRLFRSSDENNPVREVTSDASGRFVISPVESGSYFIEVDLATVPDSLVVRSIQPDLIQVPVEDVVDVSVAISFPSVTLPEARALPEGRTVFVEGIALNARSAFGDNSVHVQGGGRALRALDVAPPSVLAGDRLRLRGTTGRMAGQPVLTEVAPFILSAGGVPGPMIFTSAEAAGARDGDADANLVRVREAVIQSAQSGTGYWRITIDDGSGPVEGHLRLATIGWTQQQAQDRLTVGRRLTLTGLLIPVAGEARWRIHPRTGGDIALDP